MGLSLRLNVFGALAEFYRNRGAALARSADRQRRYDLYQRQGNWCVLDWDAGWEWKQRREAQRFVSARLNTSGLLIFVYDGNYWGYELFQNGKVLNRFVQWPSGEEQNWFSW
jgi:hypothetical protein